MRLCGSLRGVALWQCFFFENNGAVCTTHAAHGSFFSLSRKCALRSLCRCRQPTRQCGMRVAQAATGSSRSLVRQPSIPDLNRLARNDERDAKMLRSTKDSVGTCCYHTAAPKKTPVSKHSLLASKLAEAAETRQLIMPHARLPTVHSHILNMRDKSRSD